MATETARRERGRAGGSREAGCETNHPASAGVKLFTAKGASALAAGIDDVEFNVEDFLATFGALARRRGRHQSRTVGPTLHVREGDHMVTNLHMTTDGENACGCAPPCARTSVSTGGSSTVAPEVQPLQSKLGPVKAVAAMHVTYKNSNWSDKSLQNAMKAVTDDGMPLREVDRLFGVSTTSLRDHLYNKTREKHKGIKPTLKSHEEEKLVDYVFKKQELGHLLTPVQLRLKVVVATQKNPHLGVDLGSLVKDGLGVLDVNIHSLLIDAHRD